MTLISKATQVAINAHKDQVRKGTYTPYIVHPMSVARKAYLFGENEKVIAACLLHDNLEDTSYIKEILEMDFGKEIMEIVLGASENKSLPTWKERKLAYLEHLKTAPLESVKVSVYDKIDNLESIMFDYSDIEESLWERFNAGKQDQIWFYTEFMKVIQSRPEVGSELSVELEITVERFIKLIDKSNLL